MTTPQYRTFIDPSTGLGATTLAGISTQGVLYGVGISSDIVCRNFYSLGVSTIGIASVGVLTTSQTYQISTGRILGSGNELNIPTNDSITVDLSEGMVSIGTVGREPVWNFVNVPSETSRMATVTVLGITSVGAVSMGKTYTVNGGSSKGIVWSTASVPNFDASNWSILTFRIINDDVGITSIFATREA